VRVFVKAGATRLVDLVSGQTVLPAPDTVSGPVPGQRGETSFLLQLPAHSYRAYEVR